MEGTSLKSRTSSIDPLKSLHESKDVFGGGHTHLMVEKRIALLIGNSKYEDHGLRQLIAPGYGTR
jgi:hypothetical protein